VLNLQPQNLSLIAGLSGLSGVPLFGGMGGGVGGIPGAVKQWETPQVQIRKNPEDDKDGVHWDNRIVDARNKWAKEQDWREQFVRLYRYGRFSEIGEADDENVGVNVNLCFPYVQIVTALLGASAPVIEISPRRCEADKEFAESLEGWLQYSVEQTDGDEVNRVLIFAAILQGICFTKESFDPGAGMDVADVVTCNELHIDPLARYSMKEARYVIQEVVKPIDEARQFFNTGSIEPNFRLADTRENSLAADNRKHTENENADKSLLRFYEIWEKKGKERKLSYRLHDQDKRWLARGEWPFRLNSNDWPYSELRFATDHTSVDGFSEIEIAAGLQREVNELAEADRRNTRKGMGSVILADLDMLDEDTLEEKIRSNRQFEIVKARAQGKSLEDALVVKRFRDERQDVKAVYERAKQLHDEVLGMDELLRSADSRKMTATEAAVREQMQQLRSGLKVGAIDRHQARSITHRAQIARQLVDPAEIGRAVSPEAAMAFAMYAGDAEDLVKEYSISIRTGSTGEMHRHRRVQEAESNLQLIMQANEYHLNVNGRPKYDLDVAVRELQEARQVRNPDKYLLPELEPEPQPMPEPAAEMQPEPGMAAEGLPGMGAVAGLQSAMMGGM